MGYIYIFNIIGSAYYKIGKTVNVECRFNDIKSAMPFDLSICGQWHVDDCGGAEKLLHRRFRKSRIRGEWFELDYSELRDARVYLDSISVPRPKMPEIPAPQYRHFFSGEPRVQDCEA